MDSSAPAASRQRAQSFSGGRGIRLSNPLQRFFRDVHAASNHAFLSAEKGALNMGGVALGLDTADFTL